MEGDEKRAQGPCVGDGHGRGRDAQGSEAERARGMEMRDEAAEARGAGPCRALQAVGSGWHFSQEHREPRMVLILGGAWPAQSSLPYAAAPGSPLQPPLTRVGPTGERFSRVQHPELSVAAARRISLY